MKTIEVNLMGDLKQKAAPSKLGSLPSAVTGSSDEPKDQRNNMILLGLSGSGILSLLLVGLILIGCWTIGAFMQGNINKTQTQIEEKTAELLKYKKMQESLAGEIKSLELKSKVKDFLKKEKFPMASVLEELRVKIPRDLFLTEIKKAKGGFLIKGKVSPQSKEPLRSISRFIININSMLPEASIVRKAFLASVQEKEGLYEFAIKAGYKGDQLEKKKAKD
ncbi:MAG: hypothetical protein AB1782_03935 [Cyanobacteriota bacterium]